ncbi:MAG: TonB-dependent receptor [Pseudomonadota bacterium]|nr:TonB-dependent receptor [Pseudomonadota bacterium]
MQGFVPASSSVNGGGAGVTTAAIHSLPSKYTLVLVDGDRVAPQALGAVQGGGYGVNLDAIALNAVESVDVLRDGAGALYGADAIAGVVNFRLKNDSTEGNAYVTGDMTQHGGGNSWSAGISKGFGKLDEDGFNIFLSYSHEEQDALAASQRSASRQGAYFPFTSGGQKYIFFSPTSNTEPANITIGKLGVAYNPYYIANGNCGNANAFPLTSKSGQTTCRFNYAATVQDIPSTKKDSGLIKASAHIGDSGTLSLTAMVTQDELTAQYAPSAQPMGINATTRFPALWNAYVAPYLAAHNQTATTATLNYRSVSVGGRADDYGAFTTHVALKYDGTYDGFDVHAALIESHVHATDTAAGGYTDFNKVSDLIAAGTYNPVTGAGASSLQSALLNGTRFSTTNSDVKSAKLNVGHNLFNLPGGHAILSVGGEFDRTTYTIQYNSLLLSQSGFSTQPASSDYPIGGNYGQVPFGAERNNFGFFAEGNFPILDNLSVNLQGRYDNYSRVHSDYNFSASPDPVTGLQNQTASGDLGNTFHAFTGKASFRYAPIPIVAIRGSIGTGFRAPALSDIAGPLAYNGSTSGTYACPFPGSAGCLPGSAQYDLLAGGNSASGANGLKPEKSLNWTLGVALTPTRGFFVNIDYWHVRIKNQIESQGIAEQVAFNNPSAYSSLFVNPYLDPAGYQTIAFEQVPFNGGEAKYAGFDWDVGYATNTGLGKVTLDWSGTWTTKQTYTFGPGQPELTDLGVYGPDQQVVFRVVSTATASLETGKFTNTFDVHFRTGYRDQSYTAGDGVVYTDNNGTLGTAVAFAGLKVPAIATFDWQGVYKLTPQHIITFGIKNFTDKAPPLSLQTGGGGNQVGYDGRYYDILGRTFYARLNVKF